MLNGKRVFVVVMMLAIPLSLTANAADDVQKLIAALLGDTPVVEDLQELTDTIGGRPTGSQANQRAVEWAASKFRLAEVAVTTEEFEMPAQWQEESVTAQISGDIEFAVDAVAKPFSIEVKNLVAPLIDGGKGTADDFVKLGDAAQDAWLLIETPVLDDKVGLAGLFAEYSDASKIESRAFGAGALGVVFMSSRPKNLVYRHNASRGFKNSYPLLVIEREQAKRALRLLRSDRSLQFTATINVHSGGRYKAKNVIAEISGSQRPNEIVLFGAHLDSHDLGTGALDNGVNVAMLINIARQMVRLNIRPERTIRFALWNGEEQGLVGSWKYAEQHEAELDNHVLAASFDIGSGKTSGFFTGGRPELVGLVDQYLSPVAGLGPFHQVDVPIVGTDNFDFLIEGVPNIVAVQDDANYASNYHAESDTFDKVDQQQLRLNSAISAAVLLGFANSNRKLQRQTHEEIVSLIESTTLESQMRDFAVWDYWAEGERGRHD